VRGVEVSPYQARYAVCQRSLDVTTLPVEKAGFADASFDVVIASHVIEHLAGPTGFVKTVYRILKAGGSFFVTTPNIDGFQARLFGSRWRSAIFDHTYLFSIKTLRALLENHGFAVKKIATWGGLAAGCAPPLIKKAADRAVKLLGTGDVMLFAAEK
jgi:predicted SAM-dependent methyltransferase